jgi:hypothetical protein
VAAFDDAVTVPAGQWTLAGDGAQTGENITIQPLGQGIRMRGTAGNGTAPTAAGVGVIVRPGDTVYQVPLATMFPGVTNVDTVWLWSDVATTVYVSHPA